MEKLSFGGHCTLAFALRIILVNYASFHDTYFDVPYTDVDYKVFTDAARHIYFGRSPFERHTYRYSPLLAFLLTPNIFVHRDFGKVFFSLADVVLAVLIRRILLRQKCRIGMANVCAYLWLYNPLTMIVSTRGNADSLAVLPVILTLDFLQRDQAFVAGLLHGLSIHFRLYPVIFSIAMVLSLRDGNRFVPNGSQLKLIAGCTISIVALTLSCYYLYGFRYLYESVLYHLSRKDSKHNFSVYFYMLYLSAEESPDVTQKLITFLPQLTLLLSLSFRYSDKRQLPFSMFLQAMVVVTYNSVMTSQYFFWFLSLLPLCLPNIEAKNKALLGSLFAWIASQGAWLFFAYLLEFHGLDSFFYIWLSCLLFFFANIKILTDLIRCHKVR